jgi:hypothetical protein
VKRHRHLVKFVKLMSAQPLRREAATPQRAPRRGGGGARRRGPSFPGARRGVRRGRHSGMLRRYVPHPDDENPKLSNARDYPLRHRAAQEMSQNATPFRHTGTSA